MERFAKPVAGFAARWGAVAPSARLPRVFRWGRSGYPIWSMSADSVTTRELLDDPRFRGLWEILTSLDSVAVAYSGGVDSTFLLRVAHDALGERAHGVLAVSESLDRNELAAARELAARLEIPIREVETKEYENPEYRRNDANRCYHCKSELFDVVGEYARRAGIAWVLDGSHTGDVGDYRPGLRARNEKGVRSPLLEAGLDKAAIRDFSRRLGLPTWDKPAAPCLASRLPYGTEVTDERLRAVEAAERALRDLGFAVVRVRHHGDIARVEIPIERLAEALAPATRKRIIDGVKSAGFAYVTLDLEGFRSGSLNQALARSVYESGAQLVQVEGPRRQGESV